MEGFILAKCINCFHYDIKVGKNNEIIHICLENKADLSEIKNIELFEIDCKTFDPLYVE